MTTLVMESLLSILIEEWQPDDIALQSSVDRKKGDDLT